MHTHTHTLYLGLPLALFGQVASDPRSFTLIGAKEWGSEAAFIGPGWWWHWVGDGGGRVDLVIAYESPFLAGLNPIESEFLVGNVGIAIINHPLITINGRDSNHQFYGWFMTLLYQHEWPFLVTTSDTDVLCLGRWGPRSNRLLAQWLGRRSAGPWCPNDWSLWCQTLNQWENHRKMVVLWWFNGIYPLVSSNMAMENLLWMEVLIRTSLIHGPFSLAMFDYRRVMGIDAWCN